MGVSAMSITQLRKRFNGVSPAEIAFLDGVTAGTATASKALVLNASKGISTITSATITTLTSTTANLTTVNATTHNAGADATAGTVNVFPATTASGKLIMAAVNSAGAFNTTISNASMAQSTVVSIPDPGSATANFVLDKATATIGGAKTFSSAVTINPTTNQLVLGVTNTTTISATAPSTSRVVTLADPGANANLITSVGIGSVQTTRVTAQVDSTGTTLANITGLSQTVQVGTYTFDIYLPTTCGGTGGVKLAFNYTTAVLSSLSAMAYAYTASAIATASTTTTTTQTSIISSATAFTSVIIKGTMVVSTGGTVDLQFAENNANNTSSVLVNGNMKFTRIA